jgi:hypothetical protein
MLNEFQTKKFTHLFKLLDRNGDNFIDKADLENTAAALAEVRGLKTDSPQIVDLLARYRALQDTMLVKADANADGRVTLKEYLDYHQTIVAGEPKYKSIIAGIAKIYSELLDHDSDGKNDVKDYTLFLRAMRIDDAGAATTFRQLDKNADGVLSYGELEELLHQFYFDAGPAAPGNLFFGTL